jgi:uncharacterized membrane-anchored protein
VSSLRTGLIFGGLALALGVPFGLVAQKERLKTHGEKMLLQLAPADPRSLIAGDYMRLDYAISREAEQAGLRQTDGELVVKLDSDHVATLVRRHGGEPLAPDERLLRYRSRDMGHVRLASDAFYFQEGTADLYAGAKYGEVRVNPEGDALLVGLCDAERRPLGR